MRNMRDPTTDDTAELVDEEEAGIAYRLRKSGKCRLVLISIVLLLVVGIIIAVVFLLKRGM